MGGRDCADQLPAGLPVHPCAGLCSAPLGQTAPTQPAQVALTWLWRQDYLSGSIVGSEVAVSAVGHTGGHRIWRWCRFCLWRWSLHGPDGGWGFDVVDGAVHGTGDS